jgi:hypothetical protein
MTISNLLPLVVLLVPACGWYPFASKTCRKFCEYQLDCVEDQLDEQGLDCEFDDDPQEVLAECMDACQDTWKDLDKGDKEDVEACVLCVDEEVDGSCDLEDWGDAVYDDCEDECDDDDVGEFFEEVADDWDPDLECDDGSTPDGIGGAGVGGAGGNVAACERWYDEINACGEFDAGGSEDCAAYADLPCDVTAYFDCLVDNTGCNGGVLEISGWDDCTHLADC